MFKFNVSNLQIHIRNIYIYINFNTLPGFLNVKLLYIYKPSELLVLGTENLYLRIFRAWMYWTTNDYRNLRNGVFFFSSESS